METAEVTEHATKSSETTETEEEDFGNVQETAKHVPSFKSGPDLPDNSTNRGGRRFFGLLNSFAAALANHFNWGGGKTTVSPPVETTPGMREAIALYHCIESGSGWDRPPPPADAPGFPGCKRYCTPDATFDCQGKYFLKLM